mgnify:CR=1 FL=1
MIYILCLIAKRGQLNRSNRERFNYFKVDRHENCPLFI